ncbi:MAG: hypothetical protein IPM24_02135 [Bryobacterales bacterium]|nr:hypothetical protein [Bryobacterales bacterium]
MGAFLDNAASLLETAARVHEAGGDAVEFAVMVGEDGSIHMLMGVEGSPEHIAASRGWPTVYRVSHRGGVSRVEGASRSQTCRLEALEPQSAARRLLAGQPRYHLVSCKDPAQVAGF